MKIIKVLLLLTGLSISSMGFGAALGAPLDQAGANGYFQLPPKKRAKWRNDNTPKTKKKRVLKRCSVATCSSYARRGGKCYAHDNQKCSVKSCKNKVQPFCKGMCMRHGGKKCIVDGCESIAQSSCKGKCWLHGGPECLEMGCTNKVMGGCGGKCRSHGFPECSIAECEFRAQNGCNRMCRIHYDLDLLFDESTAVASQPL